MNFGTIALNQSIKLCYMDTDSFVIHLKTKDVEEDIADHVEKRFDTSNYISKCSVRNKTC